MLKEERLLEEFLELVQIDSESGDERAVADVLKQKFTDLGLDVMEEDTTATTGHNAGNVICKLKGTVENAKVVLFGAHMDTVSPGKGIKPKVLDGYVITDGTTILGADDKAGIAAILEAVRVLKEQNIPHGDIEILLTVGEEVELIGARSLDPSLLKATSGYALDTGGAVGNIKSSAPARGTLTANVYGQTAHAGVAPEKGVSAIAVAAHAIANMPLGRIDEETTANIGTFIGDGPLNVVIDHTKVVAEARSLVNEKLDAQLNQMKAAFEEAAREMGGRVEIQIESSFPAFKLGDDAPVVQVAKRAAAKIGRDCATFAAGGGSDANIINGYGIPMVVLACGYEEIHTTNERMPIAELNKLVEMTVAVIMEVAKEG